MPKLTIGVRIEGDTEAALIRIAKRRSTDELTLTKSDLARAYILRGIKLDERRLRMTAPGVTVVHAEQPVRELRPGRSERVRRREARDAADDARIIEEAEAAVRRIEKGETT